MSQHAIRGQVQQNEGWEPTSIFLGGKMDPKHIFIIVVFVPKTLENIFFYLDGNQN